MELMTEMINALRVIVPIGAGLRIIICAIRIAKGDESSIPENKQRIWNTIIFVVICACVWGIRDVVFDYFSSGSADL